MFKNIKLTILSVLILLISSDYMYAIKLKDKSKIKNNSELTEAQLEEQGWITNKDIYPSGSPDAVQGGMMTMLGGSSYPATLRGIGKDSRNTINSLMHGHHYETLLSYDYERLEWAPNLATHWKISADSLTYWFRLNPEAKFSDGTQVTAEDVAATYKLYIDDGHGDPNTAVQFRELCEIPVAESKLIVRVDAKKKDYRSFRWVAGLTVMPSAYLNKIDGAGYKEKYDFNFMPGSGPYKYDRQSSKKGNEGYIILKKRDDWWQQNNPENIGLYNFDKIKFIFILDENQQVISFFNGDYDIYPWSRAQWWVERFNNEKTEIANGWVQKIKVFNFLAKGPSGIVFNTQKKPFNDVRVRKAFAYLFDVDKLNQRLFFNEYVKLNTFFYGTPYANPNNPMLTFNPEEALKLLREAGWTRKKGNKWLTNKKGEIFEFEFLIATDGDRIYSTYQADLEGVGIKMNFEQVDGTAKFKKIMKKEYEVSNMGWTGGFFPSPEGMMHSKYADKVEVTNITSMAYPELDALIEQYYEEWDAKKRIPIAHQIDSIAVNSFHYALGWTSPYGVRMLYWNKFKMPASGVSYTGDYRSAISYWWIEPTKEVKLNNAKNNNTKLPIEPGIIDYWNTIEQP